MTRKKSGFFVLPITVLMLFGMTGGDLRRPIEGAAVTAWAETAEAVSPETVSGASPEAFHRTITDMAGRKVVIPAVIKKVVCTSPPPTTFVYMLSPERLGGWMGSLSGESKKFIPEAYHSIPVLGWGRNGTNYERYIAAAPDLAFVGFETGINTSGVDLVQEKFGAIPVVCVENTRNAVEYAKAIAFIGDVLGVPERAKALNDYYQGVLDEVRRKVEQIPEKKRVRVYYAEGDNGLSTDPSGSPHSQLIDVCGGVNVAECKISSGSGMTAVTMESVLVWKPDVIITTNREFSSLAHSGDSWEKVPAVGNKRIHVTPAYPFNWFDRPPGVNRIIGIPWTAHVLYPGLFPGDWFREKTKEFYRLYYHYALSDEELTSLLRN